MQSAAVTAYPLLLFVLLIHCCQVISLEAGEKCFHNKQSVDGTCKILDSCPSAIKGLTSEVRVFPQNCGWSGNSELVCCPITSTFLSPKSGSSSAGEKANRACKSYEKYGWRMAPSPTGIYEDFVKEDICPWEVQGITVIVEGEKTKQGEFPHMAVLGYGGPDQFTWACGGTLLSEKYVLTAVHCLLLRDVGEPKLVRLGDNNITDSSDDQYVQQIRIKKHEIHPEYRFPSAYHDIALLELERSANINLFVKPACLYVEDPVDIRTGLITGWGVTESGGDASEILLKTAVEVFAPEICNMTYRTERRKVARGIDPNIQMCYGSSKNRKDTCQGDSGGPIQRYSNNVHCSYEVFGVTSFGKKCGKMNIPGVYVKLYNYIDWIEKIVWP